MSAPGGMDRVERPLRVGMVSLGCAKNLVDAEIMLGSATRDGFEITSDTSLADIVVVNTCGFIDSAKEESIEAILTARQFDGQKLIVAGCLAQRHRKELEEELPEVDAFMGLDDVARAGEIIHAVAGGNKPSALVGLVSRRSRYIPDYDTPRYRLTAPHTAYVKIAEGCNHPCSFCVIPRMRGAHRSRTIQSVVEEARRLVESGVRELNLISQDTTYFGMDLWEKKPGPRQPVEDGHGPTLADLLDELGQIEGDFWIRLLYTHPAHWGGGLIRSIARNPRVARYIDMPLQHIHEEMLSQMRRETSRKHIEELIGRLRAEIPGLAIRTTFIVGFPGETEEHFESLLEFIRETRFERLGVFKYSQEEGSRAAKMPGQVSERTKTSRFRRAMAEQQRIAAEMAASARGKTLRVLADTPGVARTEYDAPDVDTRVILSREVPAGMFHNVKVTGSHVYDLLADPL
ncbi:MAG: 30S ribosomal protein S12 methylthiotransferase RimO [Terrimicrobiaceae bacterium]